MEKSQYMAVRAFLFLQLYRIGTADLTFVEPTRNLAKSDTKLIRAIVVIIANNDSGIANVLVAGNHSHPITNGGA
jgi:hypothetical protein